MTTCGYFDDEGYRCVGRATVYVDPVTHAEHFACPAHAKEAHEAGAKLECGSCGELCQGMTEELDPWRTSHGWRCDACNEASAERAIEAFYGGSGPQTTDEQCAAAMRVKRAR